MKKILLFLIVIAPLIGALYAFSESILQGTGALGSLTTGDENAALGSYSLQSLTTGYGNTALGMFAGRSTITVNGGVYLGYGAGVSNTSAHKLFLQTMFYPSYGIFGDFSTGYFGINTSSPTAQWTVSGISLADTVQTTNLTVTGYTILPSLISNGSIQNTTGAVSVADSVLVSKALMYRVPIITISDLTTDTTLREHQSGSLVYMANLSAKKTIMLPPAALGINFKFIITDSDSGRVTANAGDTIQAWGADKVLYEYSTISGTYTTFELVAPNASFFTVLEAFGQNTSY